MRWMGIVPLLLLVSCAPLQTQEFIISSLSTQEGDVPCVVLVEDEIQVGKDAQEMRTPARVSIKFRNKMDGTGYEGVKVGVRPVKVDAEGKIIHGLRKGETSEYQEDSRSVYPWDATRQLFVLYKRRL